MPDTQTWDPESYSKNARFVSDLGQPVVELLSPRAGERILDLGCGDGALTRKLASMGCDVVGVDSSAAQIEAARQAGLKVFVMDATALSFDQEFDAVFSNAVLHWVKRTDQMMAGVWRALKPGGRFVAEMGGHGCVAQIVAALSAALSRRGIAPDTVNPWYFPTDVDYRKRLENAGFDVAYIALIPRPTPLPGDITGWLEIFAQAYTSVLPPSDRPKFITEVQEALRPALCGTDGKWVADYVRLRFAATKRDARGREHGALDRPSA
ncbi:MAG TPA: class I SAM-dependent methyltransferase [Verrucomicrobiae bacterium]|nr:class I SAM-dependent methyltransferase [Verrucomicrobiae bacterium]